MTDADLDIYNTAKLHSVCRQLIDDLRSDMYMAVRMDEFVKLVNERLRVEVGERDVKECLRYDTTVKIVETKNAEVIWLWEKCYELIEKVADMAARYRAVLSDPENLDEYDDDR